MKLLSAKQEPPATESWMAEPKYFVARLSGGVPIIFSPASRRNVMLYSERPNEEWRYGTMEELIEVLKNEEDRALTTDQFKLIAENEKLRAQVASLEQQIATAKQKLAELAAVL